MNSLLEAVDLLFPEQDLPMDSTGSLGRIAELLETLRPGWLFLADATGRPTAALSKEGRLDKQTLRAAAERLRIQLASQESVVIDGTTGSGSDRLLGVRLGPGGFSERCFPAAAKPLDGSGSVRCCEVAASWRPS